MLFRVDDNEEAHLFFVNSQVQEILGYSPEEYVLASESADSRIKNEISSLVERIAELSHDGGGQAEPICRLHSRRVSAITFSFEFRIFTVKSSPLPFIVVSLEPMDKEPVEAAMATDKRVDTTAVGEGALFVSDSPLMKALMKKLDMVIDKHVHLLFRGERGTGKRTLAKQVVQAEKLNGAETLVWDLPDTSASRQDELVQQLCAGDSADGAVSDRLTLLILEISRLSLKNQQKLLEWLRNTTGDRVVRIIATTRTLLEDHMNRGRFSMELYYHLSFDTILLPPLVQRREDIDLLIDRWVSRASRVLELGELEIGEPVRERLLHHSWPGNFHDFYDTMRRSLLRSGQGVFRLALESGQEESRKKKSAVSPVDIADEVLPFDEMSRLYLEKVLKKTQGKIYGRDGAAHLLGMKPTTLQSKLKKLGVR
ncbi:sigma 54-interacting transcriptional regulator [Balneolales bacterium ANBcel1]|nr:sigma 54-interacting transcriptional regulator [Balneolales bacterium ANBcel1]